MKALSNLQQLLADEAPLIDVRAPVEFAQGAFPSAVNLPILDDEERHRVGLCYREEGPEAATRLGHQLVAGQVKQSRIQAWIDFIDQHPNARLYCFRGGQRSGIACQWLSEAGYRIDRVEGGYKALRRSLLAVYEQLPSLLVVSGRTGSGKTLFLKNFSPVIDLEGAANHRGSAFGGYPNGQPSQVDFENRVAIRFLQLADHSPVLIEDEGRLIGRIHVPLPLQEAMRRSPLLVIEDDVAIRGQRILDEYIVEQSASYEARYGEAGFDQFAAYLLAAADAIRKRLGNVAHQEVREAMIRALDQQHLTGDPGLHLAWINRLLTEYYDPIYDYQLKSKSSRILVRGSHEEVLDWVTSHLESGCLDASGGSPCES